MEPVFPATGLPLTEYREAGLSHTEYKEAGLSHTEYREAAASNMLELLQTKALIVSFRKGAVKSAGSKQALIQKQRDSS